MIKPVFDEEGFLDEPCLSCDNAYLEDIWNEWCCDEKTCPYKAETEGHMKYAEEIIKEIKNRGTIDTDDYLTDDDWEEYIRGKESMNKRGRRMTDYKKYINALRKCAKEHEGDKTFTGQIIVSNLCRDTANLLETLEQEPFINKPCVSNEVCEHDKNDVIDKIRAEIEQLPTNTRINWDGCCPDIDYPEIEFVDVSKAGLLEIINKYKAETEDKE